MRHYYRKLTNKLQNTINANNNSTNNSIHNNNTNITINPDTTKEEQYLEKRRKVYYENEFSSITNKMNQNINSRSNQVNKMLR